MPAIAFDQSHSYVQHGREVFIKQCKQIQHHQNQESSRLTAAIIKTAAARSHHPQVLILG